VGERKTAKEKEEVEIVLEFDSYSVTRLVINLSTQRLREARPSARMVR